MRPTEEAARFRKPPPLAAFPPFGRRPGRPLAALLGSPRALSPSLPQLISTREQGGAPETTPNRRAPGRPGRQAGRPGQRGGGAAGQPPERGEGARGSRGAKGLAQIGCQNPQFAASRVSSSTSHVVLRRRDDGFARP